MQSILQRLMERYRQGERLFHGWDLTGCDLSHVTLPEIDLSYSVFKDSCLIGTDLEWAILRNVNFTNANLTQAHLRRTNLRRANLTNAIFQQADLRAADLSGATVVNTSFVGSNLWGVVAPEGGSPVQMAR